MKEVADLKPGHVIAVSDYMMKLVFRRLYEPQKEWFGKKGTSVHGVMFLYREEEVRQMTHKTVFLVQAVLRKV